MNKLVPLRFAFDTFSYTYDEVKNGIAGTVKVSGIHTLFRVDLTTAIPSLYDPRTLIAPSDKSPEALAMVQGMRSLTLTEVIALDKVFESKVPFWYEQYGHADIFSNNDDDITAHLAYILAKEFTPNQKETIE